MMIGVCCSALSFYWPTTLYIYLHVSLSTCVPTSRMAEVACVSVPCVGYEEKACQMEEFQELPNKFLF
jgi:hypothetical protein